MDPAKRQALINSAMKEFGENGYAKASTNAIVNSAGISKGLLFHYFESKEALFAALRTYTMELIRDAINKGVDWEKGDPINRLLEIATIKMGFFKRFPYLASFGKVMFEGESIERVWELTDLHMPNLSARVYTHNIDRSVFKEGLDPARVMKIIQLFLDGFSEEIFMKYIKAADDFDMDSELRDLEAYMATFKEAFYRARY
ncbi:MAG: TetR/AcrR family transcriptional regulator [Spirochaetes bacterium]|nr:TetR/AcrR family transcriptional regulator [Spirochaetota bacterium]MBU1080205.1 TetR/AcrR family transcriptional regulator [Spirochaetota bacterium]